MASNESEPFDLRQLQKWMQTVITHESGVTSGIESREARGEIDVSAEQVEQVISRSNKLTSIERLEVYGNAYYARLLECLGECFPALVNAIGEEVFNDFAFEYLQCYPSRSYTLDRLGDHFAQHLQETRPDADENGPGEVGWPDFLIDLVTLEWNIEKIFDGPGIENEKLLDLDHIQAVSAELWPQAVLQPVPCLHVFAFRFPVNTYFTQFRNDEQPDIPPPDDQFVALNRLHYVVRRFELDR
ncbi:MAG: DNA-binding domain-containing protein, partial [Planctomycetales bacterium]